VVLLSGVDGATDALSREFARQFYASHDQFQIVITNINSLAAWVRLKEYLRGLHGMSRLQIERLSPNRMVLTIEMAGGHTALDRLIRLGRTLRPLPPAAPTPIELVESAASENRAPIPHYQLLP
jgi:hypothetical protein